MQELVLQELALLSDHHTESFKDLQHVILPQLQVLKFPCHCTNHEYLIKFLENNGMFLKELYIHTNNNSLNLAIAKFCSNLKSLCTIFNNDEMETLKAILIGCQQLESIKVWCGDSYLNENKLLEVVVKCSPKKFHEVKILQLVKIRKSSWIMNLTLSEREFFLGELEPILISWANRIPPKLLSLIVLDNLKIKKESMEVIEKFKKSGIIKKFETYNDYV